MNKQNDKRRTSRAGFILESTLEVNETRYGCRIRNFSLTGLLIEAHEAFLFKPRDTVTIWISLPGEPDGPSPIHCQVVHCSTRYAGVNFTAIDFDTLMALKEILYRMMQNDDRIEAEILGLIRDTAGRE